MHRISELAENRYPASQARWRFGQLAAFKMAREIGYVWRISFDYSENRAVSDFSIVWWAANRPFRWKVH
jgi:hypothetical protein